MTGKGSGKLNTTHPTQIDLGPYKLTSKAVGSIARHLGVEKQDITVDQINSLTYAELEAISGVGTETLASLTEQRFRVIIQKEEEAMMAEFFDDPSPDSAAGPSVPASVSGEGHLLIKMKPDDIGWLANLAVAYGMEVEQKAAHVIKEWCYRIDPSKLDRPNMNQDHLKLNQATTSKANIGAASSGSGHSFTSRTGSE